VLEASTAKVTASEPSAREARRNTTADKVTTSKAGAGKVTSKTPAGEATASVPTSKASSSKSASNETSAAETTVASAAAGTVEGNGISWNWCSAEKSGGERDRNLAQHGGAPLLFDVEARPQPLTCHWSECSVFD
jgi:hypothetical protein